MNKFTNTPFYTYDTVEVRYLNYPELKNFELTRGFLFYYTSNYGLTIYSKNIIFNDVVLGFYNETNCSFIGHNIIIKTCNMVLIEKFDWRLRRALGTHQTVAGDNAVILG